MTDFASEYRGKRVLLTGHTGFKGGWLALWLVRLGADVTGYALAPSTDRSLFESSGLGGRMRSIIGDIRDYESLARAWRETRPDAVFHLAAQPIVRESYRDPLATIQTNVVGTAHVLEAARQSGQPAAIVVVTSDKCYENQEWLFGYRESDPLGGRDLYSASKAAAEVLTSSYRRSFFHPDRVADHGIAVATARAGNVVGGGDWAADRIVPDCMRALSAGASIAVRNPGATRPWQHVLEPLGGYLMLGARLLPGALHRAAFCDAWNFGPDPAGTRSVRDVVERVVARAGRGAWHAEETPGPHEAGLLQVCSDKARLTLGWRPRWSFEQTIDRTVDWYEAFRSGRDAADLCAADIDEWSQCA